MNIYIPSSGRPGEQFTLSQIPDHWKGRTFLVVPESEMLQYEHDAKVHRCALVGCPHKGIGPTRQFIISASYPRPVCMLDDDLRFFKRRHDDRTKFEDAYQGDMDLMLQQIERQLQKFAAVGVCPREGGNRYPDHAYFNCRLLRVLAYDTIVLSRLGVRFDDIPVMEDFYVALTLLTQGYENLMLSDWCHNQRGSNERGGCSQYRTMDVQKQAAHKLAEMFPDFVTVVTKTTKTAWGGQERTDVRVQWKKAYVSSQRANGALDK